MQISLNGENFIKRKEELRLVAYKPLATDVWTIGWGHTKGVQEGDTITEDEAEQYFMEDLVYPQSIINHYVKVELTQNQYDAIVSLVFNIGAGAFLYSNAFKMLNQGNYEQFAYQAFDETHGFVKSGGVIVEGLVTRRAEENALFNS